MRAIKKIAAILLSVIFALALCACANGNDKSTDETDAGQEKELVWHCYTLRQAYDNGWILRNDILSIAYYYDLFDIPPYLHTPTRIYNKFGWREMGEWYEPKPKTPEELDEQTLSDMKHSFLEYRNVNPDDYDIEDKYVYYLGEYNGCIAGVIFYSFGGLQDSPTPFVYPGEIVGDAVFDYVSQFRINIWRKTAEKSEKPTDIEQAENEPGWHCYTLQQAYNKNWITQDDLLNIAYYYDQTDIPHKPSSFDKGLVAEEYEPKPKTPEELDEQTLEELKRAYLKYKKENPNNYDIENKYVYYLGEYNGSIACIIRYFGGYKRENGWKIGGVEFDYPSWAIEINIWRKTI